MRPDNDVSNALGGTLLETKEQREAREKLQAAEAVRDEERSFRRQQVTTNWFLAFVGLVTAGCTAYQGIIANRTLNELRYGSGAQDTHTLALAAKTQAEDSQVLAKSAQQQAEATRDFARTTLTQVQIAQSQKDLATAQAMQKSSRQLWH